jgi:hypothetical protein
VFNDKVIDSASIVRWYSRGKLHRMDGPAVTYADGSKEWYQNGKRHREGGPAIERSDGYKAWYQNGDFHREEF